MSGCGDQCHEFRRELVRVLVDLIKEQRTSYEAQDLNTLQSHKEVVDAQRNEIVHLRDKGNPWMVLSIMSWMVTMATLIGTCLFLVNS